MNPSTDRIRRLTLLGTLLLAAGGAGAFTFIRNATGLPVKWPAGTISFRVSLGATQDLSDGTSFNTTAAAAAAEWNAVLGNAQIQMSFASGPGRDGDDVNDMFFAPNIYGRQFGDNALAVATQWGGTGSNNERTEADIIFNSDRVWNSFRGQRPGNIDPNAIDLRRVALHELGHALGLTHPDEASPPQTVFAVMNSRVSSIDALTEDDIAGGQRLYGPPGAPANDNFANATALIHGDSGTIVATGYNTNASKQANEPAHGDNAGGSSVWWRWTAPGSGRVDVNTRDSFYDTTLGVYTGSSVSSLTTIATNDDIENAVIQASAVTFSATSGTTYHIAVDGWDNDTGGIRLTLIFDSFAGLAPTISTQPASLGVTAGNTANFSVIASGSNPLAFQWFFNGNAIAGATGSTLAVANAQPANAGSYHVVVSNPGGSVTSATATLTVTVNASSPPPASSSGGGGGGAPSGWFVALLAVLAGVRWRRKVC